MDKLLSNKEYKNWLSNIKDKIQSTQIKAAISVNKQLIHLYYYIGKQIYLKQQNANWGDKIIEQVSKDLKADFSNMKGFSLTNLKYMRSFYQFYSSNTIGQQAVDQNAINSDLTDNEQSIISQQAVGQIPWGHNILIFTKSKVLNQAQFYIQQTIVNNWSRGVLALQIKSDLYSRQGKAITNFKTTLPSPMSDLANQTIKDPYVFDFMTFTKPYKEKDIENQLIEHISKFLLELGKGFAYVGKQYHLEIAKEDYYLDLLFYHIHLKCYVVIELKNTKFIPEYAGKMNFYLSAVDTLLKDEIDKPTIGIILCRDKNNITTEFALRDFNKPMGVSEFQFIEKLPENLKSSLPTIEEIEEGIRS